MSAKKTKLPDFESALKELNTLVEEMEQGGLSLEQSLKHFERGINLTRQCQQALKEAEQKIKILTEENGEEQLHDFTIVDEED